MMLHVLICRMIYHKRIIIDIVHFSFDSLNDFSGTDNLVAITQLREEVESLKKQLQSKDQQILDREKKVRASNSIYQVTIYGWFYQVTLIMKQQLHLDAAKHGKVWIFLDHIRERQGPENINSTAKNFKYKIW